MSADLTKNQRLVLEVLRAESGPLTAYVILERLRHAGLRAPPQIYRALNQLKERALVHKLDSLNAFIACQNPECSGHNVLAFAICDRCEKVAEVAHPALSNCLSEIADRSCWEVTLSNVEIHGLCRTCQEAS